MASTHPDREEKRLGWTTVSPEIFIPAHNLLVHTNMVQKQCVFQGIISQKMIFFALIHMWPVTVTEQL